MIVNYVDGVFDPAQPDQDIVTRYEYDGAGNHVSTVDTLSRETRAEYDDLDRLEQTIVNYQDGSYNPAQPDQDLITRYTYDKVGNVKTRRDPLNRITSYEYDALNRVITLTNPLDDQTLYAYRRPGPPGERD